MSGARLLTAPDLLVYEVANALRFKPDYNPKMVLRALDDLFDLQLDLVVPGRNMIKGTTELAHRFSITAYDACYLALGGLLGAKVVTADTEMYAKVQTCGFLLLLKTEA